MSAVQEVDGCPPNYALLGESHDPFKEMIQDKIYFEVIIIFYLLIRAAKK